MKPFEFVLVIISVVIGLALTEFANLVANLIKNYNASSLSLPYIAILLTGLAGGLNYWGTVYLLRNVLVWDNLKMGLLFFTGLTYYATARVFIPEFSTFNHNYIEYYHETISTALAMMICFVISVMAESYALRKGRPSKWYATMVLFILFLLSGIVITSRAYREILAFIILALQVLNLVINRVLIADKTIIKEQYTNP